ncbi:bifunctional adenosylcobinamide kinase/adenosylcobinamide-phosphate guanylyltransferase [Desertimonas flava]|uniref:bifunctional adenosylcobinamide kinase/adenosylcobinamide-phosphate guanylyltransferase n=1 Tax=Desertimonas flava TaxID=2064846 RepID=UPI000E352A10|nr:bifunctional adenosylcobinamide kinase/adenosylcobinamide-phosphate guanylyltransferase [Desertimonas flava]
MTVTFLVGGARSGKSRFAVEFGRRHEAAGGTVSFVATAPRLDDADWAERIDRHIAERPAWRTIEEPVDLVSALTTAGDDLAIVDCLTLWVSNLMFAEQDDEAILAAAAELSDVARSRSAPTVVVSNEVGLGIHPHTELGRRFRDVLGTVNQRVGTAADRCLLFVAGRAVDLADPFDLISPESR